MYLHTDISSEGDVGTAMRLAHHGYHCDAGGCSDGLGPQLGQECLLVGLRNSGDDVDQSGLVWEGVLPGYLAL